MTRGEWLLIFKSFARIGRTADPSSKRLVGSELRWNERAFGVYPHHRRRVPHIPDFLGSFMGSLNFMRLSVKKGAHAVLSRAACRKFGASRSFFARCGIPQASPSSLPGPHNSVGVPHVRTSVRGPKTMGEAQPQPLVADWSAQRSGATRGISYVSGKPGRGESRRE
jgi:hypothetical protein